MRVVMRCSVPLSLLGVLWLGLAGAVLGEVPNRTGEELERGSSHIFTGKVQTLYRSVKRGAQYEETQGLAEVVVDKVAKGEGVKPGEPVFVRYWQQRWIGKGSPPPGSNGHHIPAEGTRVRAYVERGKDGTLEVLLPNGLVELKE